jgi:hypothetical protein
MGDHKNAGKFFPNMGLGLDLHGKVGIVSDLI